MCNIKEYIAALVDNQYGVRVDEQDITPLQSICNGNPAVYDNPMRPFAPQAYNPPLIPKYCYFGKVKILDNGNYGQTDPVERVELIARNESADKRAPEPLAFMFGDLPVTGYQEDMPEILFDVVRIVDANISTKTTLVFVGWQIKLG